jgi:hypothetical protein
LCCFEDGKLGVAAPKWQKDDVSESKSSRACKQFFFWVTGRHEGENTQMEVTLGANTWNQLKDSRLVSKSQNHWLFGSIVSPITWVVGCNQLVVENSWNWLNGASSKALEASFLLHHLKMLQRL